MDFSLEEIFQNKLHEIETRFCLACNYTLQSQKGHTCLSWDRNVTDEDKYGYANFALEELENEKLLTKDNIVVIKKWLLDDVT